MKKAIQKQIEDWEELLCAVRENAAHLRDIDEFCRDLERVIAEARLRLRRRDALEAARRQATRELQEALEEGRDIAIRTRSHLRGVLGPYNEQLALFGVAPIRRRGRR